MAELIKLFESNTDRGRLEYITGVLRSGGLVIFPTDTIYALGCDVTNKKAVEKVARIKGVKLEKANLSFICSDLKVLGEYVAQIETSTFKILKRSLPGPYTFLLPHGNRLPNFFGKKKTVGIRIPDNPITLRLIDTLGNPLVSTSIKEEETQTGYITDPELILEKWGHLVDVVIDAGPGGLEPSTVIDLTSGEPKLVREGKGSLLV